VRNACFLMLGVVVHKTALLSLLGRFGAISL
jgi:hypothetical protein